MERIYCVTGGSGHLGNALIRKLKEENKTVYALMLPQDDTILEGVHPVVGDVTSKDSLHPFFNHNLDKEKVLIHCAGLISIKSEVDPLLYEVNVIGTKNIMDLSLEYGISKVIYVSSVHALKELPQGEVIDEVDSFDKEGVIGAYAKTKAEASQIVMDAIKNGLNAVIVHPSGIVGPYDKGNGHFTVLIREYYKGNFNVGVKGGYDLVDVRDVAQGILNAVDKGKVGECYLLSNRYYSVRELFYLLSKVTGKRKVRLYMPIWLAKMGAPLAETYFLKKGIPPLFSEYSIYTLASNSNFTNKKARKELGFTVRNLEDTLRDTINWLKEENRI